MRFLFLHSNFPAQFRFLATQLAKDANNEVVFATMRKEGELTGVKKYIYVASRQPHPKIHHYVRPLESAVLQGQGAYRLGQKLRKEGFIPDVIYAHSGWGPGLFMKDVFPKARYLCYFEWFYRAFGSDADFDPADPLDANDVARIRVKNAPILLDLVGCDGGLSPTQWQRQQFPSEFHPKMRVLHDGVDTAFFQPQAGVDLGSAIASRGFSLPPRGAEIVTYVARGMEPYRGFPQFMQMVALLQRRRPQCHVVVVGEDRVAYGKTLPDGKTYKQSMLEQLDLDLSRLHFTGLLPYPQYLKVLQASSVHVYLTRPFVLSWSMLEAMSVGCLVVGSRTPPVEEVITDGVNGFLVNFFSPDEICDRVVSVLQDCDRLEEVRKQARETILQRYDLAKLLPVHLNWVQFA